jgi:cyclopropane fatty-acyl-phospholipid synthase-like methyltransferase
VDGRALPLIRASPRCRTPRRSASSSRRAAGSAASANVQVITCDVNELFKLDPNTFDRCVSIEMFEHMRNYEELLGRIHLLAQARRQAVRAHLRATAN